MPNLYICRCFIADDLVAKFRDFYGETCYMQLSGFALGLLIAQEARFSEMFENRLIRFNDKNPHLEVLVDEQLTGNNSHLYAFIDLKYEDITSAEQLLNFYK